MESNALYKLTYGLFLLTANENGFDNGCIINTAIQVANAPTRLAISVTKSNKTHIAIKTYVAELLFFFLRLAMNISLNRKYIFYDALLIAGGNDQALAPYCSKYFSIASRVASSMYILPSTGLL